MLDVLRSGVEPTGSLGTGRKTGPVLYFHVSPGSDLLSDHHIIPLFSDPWHSPFLRECPASGVFSEMSLSGFLELF